MYTRKFSIGKKFRSGENSSISGDDAYFAKHVCIRGNLSQGKKFRSGENSSIFGENVYFAKHVCIRGNLA